MDTANERDLIALVENAPIGICVLDAQTLTAEIVNDSFIAVAGKQREEILGRYYWDTFAEVRQYYEEALSGVVREGEPFYANEVELELIRHGKPERVFVTFVYAPLKDGSGNVKKVAVWVLENTLQVTGRQKVEEAQQKAELAISSAGLGVFEFTYDTNDLIANQRFEEIFDCVGAPGHRALLDKLHPEDRPIRDKAHELSKETGQLHYEARLILSNGAISWIRISGKITKDATGNPEKLIGVCQDITDSVLAQKKIEAHAEMLRNMIVQAPVAMCILEGTEHRVTVANTKMFEIWGKDAEALLNKPIFEGLPEAKEQGFEELLSGVLQTGVPFIASERPVILPRNGSLQQTYLNFTYDAIKTDRGIITGVLAVAVDVTDQVLARQKIEELVEKRTVQLKHANDALIEKNAELAQFAYIASHDLQEPLRKIGTFAGRLSEDAEFNTNEKSRIYLDRIKNASRRMGNLITDILAYSSLPKEKGIFENVDLNATAARALEDLDLVIEVTGAAITWNSLPVLKAIPIQMDQLFANMLGNALKFIRSGVPPKIHIFCMEATPAEIEDAGLDNTLSYYKITFSDNGIGISPEYTEKIFSIFQRLHSKDEFEGTGIGLAMCRKIALNHDGEIDARGSSTEGAVFNVYLPAILSGPMKRIS